MHFLLAGLLAGWLACFLASLLPCLSVFTARFASLLLILLFPFVELALPSFVRMQLFAFCFLWNFHCCPGLLLAFISVTGHQESTEASKQASKQARNTRARKQLNTGKPGLQVEVKCQPLGP